MQEHLASIFGSVILDPVQLVDLCGLFSQTIDSKSPMLPTLRSSSFSRMNSTAGGTPVDDTATTPPVDQTWIETHALEEVVSTLAWAVRQRVITPDDATLLTGMCTGPKPATATYAYDHAAQTQGITPDAARKRASRAITQLRRHLATTAA